MLVFPIGPIDLLSSLSALKCPLPSITRSHVSIKILKSILVMMIVQTIAIVTMMLFSNFSMTGMTVTIVKKAIYGNLCPIVMMSVFVWCTLCKS